jgi:GTP cyclohydrolase I
LWELAVSLAGDKRGTHMSRFLEVLSEFSEIQTVETIGEMCAKIKERLKAKDAFLTLEFPWFIEKTAPVSKRIGKLDIDVRISISASIAIETEVSIKVPATSLCPCSKQISKYGAHNQRCELTLAVRFEEGKTVSLEELFEIAESSASAPVFSVIKREDEKHVTEQAYENPKFCEDTARDLAELLNSDTRIKWYKCSVENFESIHSHNAFAEITSE